MGERLLDFYGTECPHCIEMDPLVERLEKEVILFTLIIIFLFSFIIYKKAFLEYGIGIISQGIPSNLVSDYFRNINILDLIIGVGILPLIFGSYGVFSGIREKNKGLHLINGFIFSIFLLLVFRLIEFYIGIMFLGIFLAITSSIGLYVYQTTKRSRVDINKINIKAFLPNFLEI